MAVCIAWAKSRGENSVFRLINERFAWLVQGLEQHSTLVHLVDQNRDMDEKGPATLPVSGLRRCNKVKMIKCHSHNLRSLEGCPNGLKKLEIGAAPLFSDLSPLASCSMMESLKIYSSSITDISVVSSMPLLENFGCHKGAAPSIEDFSPLSSCPRLKHLDLSWNYDVEDLSPLSACTALEYLCVGGCSIVSLVPLSGLKHLKVLTISENERIDDLSPLSLCGNLEDLNISNCPIADLTPLSSLSKLHTLNCQNIASGASALPLASCLQLRRLYSYEDDEDIEDDLSDLEQLKARLPLLRVSTLIEMDSDEEEEEEEEEEDDDDSDGDSDIS